MTTTELGIYNLTLSIYMVIITIVGSSIPLTISKITAQNKTHYIESETKYSVTSSLILTTLVSIVLSIILIISKPLIILLVGDELGYSIILSLIPSIIFTAIYSQIRGYLWGLENYFAVSIVEFVEQILRIGFCFLFGLLNIFKSPVISVGLSLSIACGISTIYGIILYLKNGGKFKYKKGYFKDIVKSSLPLTATRIFGSLLQPLIAIILPLRLCAYGMSKELALSELGIIMGMAMPLLSIPSTLVGAMCMILIPRLNSDKEKTHIHSQINNYINFTISCNFLFIPVFLSLSIPICNYVFSNVDAGYYMIKCCWIIIPLGLSQITSAILNAIGNEHKSFLNYLISSILMILVIIIFPAFTGVRAMLIASGFSSILLLALNLAMLKRQIGFKPKFFKPLILHIFITIPVLILDNFVYNIFANFSGSLISIIITGLISILGYFAMLFIFGILNFKSLKNYVLKSFNAKANKI